ncbi:hypothetical protein CPT_Shaeky_059 [Streptomyces phage Shaeky]|uniref:Uncharacterized protein n=1 Tax=Streptomyces phage Shaeky TaxID=2767586 RepID=A0A873WJR8_9CAUD|nr:hypothetical protein CPT_Shaeky_059 [Streptomyces phage Shaeky]
MNRYEIVLTGPDAPVHTFTWAETPEDAAKRVGEQMAAAYPLWDGWTARISTK